jgi:hypothetical protein
LLHKTALKSAELFVSDLVRDRLLGWLALGLGLSRDIKED